MSRDWLRRKFLSLSGHIVVLGGVGFLTSIGICIHDASETNQLTVEYVLRMSMVFVVASVISGVLAWYLVTKPAMRKYK